MLVRDALIVCLVVASAAASTVGADGTSQADIEPRLQTFLEEIRCLVCQNETLAESRADLAADLREEIRAQMLAGTSDQDIRDFLVARYGDFVLYRPPMKPETYPLWFGPLFIFVCGLTLLCRAIIRRSSVTPGAVPTKGELERVRRLLTPHGRGPG